MKTWLDGVIGWSPMDKIETWWIGDPAVDTDKSDGESYYRTLDKSYLKTRQDSKDKPVSMEITLPDSAMLGNIRPHISSAGYESACVIAFELCARFPDVAAAKPNYRLGFMRLPADFVAGILRQYPEMILAIGTWIINKCFLDDAEKKTLSLESTARTLSTADSTTVIAAMTDGNVSSGAQNSA